MSSSSIRTSAVVTVLVFTLLVAGVGHTTTGVSAQSLGDLEVSVDAPTEVTVGEEARVSGEVSVPDVPRRDVSTDVTVEFRVDGRTIDTQTITIADGSTGSATFTHTFDTEGTATVEVVATTTLAGQDLSGSASRDIEVVQPDIGDLSLAVDPPQEPTVGDQASIGIEVGVPDVPNTDTTATVTITVEVDGETVATRTIDVTDGSSETTSVDHTFASAGTHTVTVTAEATVADQRLSKSVSREVQVVQPPIDDPELSVSVPSEAQVDRTSTIEASVTVPGIDGDDTTATVMITVTVDGEAAATRELTVQAGETGDVAVDYTYRSEGEATVTVTARVELAGQTREVSRSRTVDVLAAVPTRSGVAFTVPDSLEDEVEAAREDADVEDDLRAFVLATPDRHLVVFTRSTPKTGRATVTGPLLETTVEEQGLTFGVVAATETEFSQEGQEAAVREVAGDPEQYELQFVEVTAPYRRVSTLTDTDGEDEVTVVETAGVLEETPAERDLSVGMASRARGLSINTTEQGRPTGDDVRDLLGPSEPYLVTASFEKAFWMDAEATVTGVVLTPGSNARTFVEQFDTAGAVPAADDEPLVYTVTVDHGASEYDTVRAVSQQAGDGDVIAVDARLFQGKISVQETIEHETPCDTTLVPVEKSCVNVPQDQLVHGGVAWSTVPESRDDLLGVVGVSSRESDKPFVEERGRYRIVGEVVRAERVNPSLPEGKMLVIYDIRRTGDIDQDEVRAEARQLIRDRLDDTRYALESDVLDRKTGSVSTTATESLTAGQSTTVQLPEPTTNGNQPGATVTSLSLTTTQDVSNARVRVATDVRLPPEIDPGLTDRATYLDIAVAGIGDSAIDSAIFEVTVTRSAVQADPAALRAFRYHDGEWVPLEAEVDSSTATTATLSIKTPGFSYFAITDGTQPKTDIPAATATGTTAASPDAATDAGAETPTSTAGNGPGFGLLAAMVALLITLSVTRRR
jgi:PGF-pre-PGF domain-containing protein